MDMCEYAKETCEKCGLSFSKKYAAEHKKTDCLEDRKPCPNVGCTMEVKAEVMDMHLRQCLYRRVLGHEKLIIGKHGAFKQSNHLMAGRCTKWVKPHSHPAEEPPKKINKVAVGFAALGAGLAGIATGGASFMASAAMAVGGAANIEMRDPNADWIYPCCNQRKSEGQRCSAGSLQCEVCGNERDEEGSQRKCPAAPCIFCGQNNVSENERCRSICELCGQEKGAACIGRSCARCKQRPRPRTGCKIQILAQLDLEIKAKKLWTEV
jgi:hypothetical protein